MLLPFTVKAQETIVIEPLFDYPVAPEELVSLEEKCNFIVKNFWNDFNFKTKASVDQNALNDAFMVYTSALTYASDKEITQSVNKLLEKLSGNPVLLLQFCKAAEENLYGPRAEIWSDKLFLRFLEAVIKNKKIPDSRKVKYTSIYQALTESQVGNQAPSFSFIDKNNEKKKYFPMSTPTMLIFGNPDETDWRLVRIKMDLDVKLSEALEKGKINIIYIIPYKLDNWQDIVSNYNTRWAVGQSDEASQHYDIRFLPSLYLISSDGKIDQKNIPLQDAIQILTSQ